MPRKAEFQRDSFDARACLRALFDAAVAAADPLVRLPELAGRLPGPRPGGRTVVMGAGKAAASMARAIEREWDSASDGALEGLVVTRYGHGLPLNHVQVIEAGHPMPDKAGLEAAETMLRLAEGLGADDLALCLISGGGSALMALPADGVALRDKQQVNKALLRSGATISEINCVRKHLSRIKGGRLARAALPARVVCLAISDVPGDDPDVIASGPTQPDPTTLADARALLDRYGIKPPKPVVKALTDPANETPKPGDPDFAEVGFHLIARPQDSLEAAAETARAWGLTPVILGDSIEGEAREVARVHAGIALQCARFGQPAPLPAVILSGGETTVTVRGGGRGGRNAEFLLALTLALDGHPDIHAVACDTDGIDGTEDNAGAIAGPDTLSRLREASLDARAMLEDNDGYSAFAALDDLIITGPTRTNVNDFRAILVL